MIHRISTDPLFTEKMLLDVDYNTYTLLEKVLDNSDPSFEEIQSDLEQIVHDMKIEKNDIAVIVRLIETIRESVQMIRHGNKDVVIKSTIDIVKILIHGYARYLYPDAEENIKRFFDQVDACIDTCVALINFSKQHRVHWDCRCC